MKTGTKIFLGVLASAILVGGLGALTRGFTNWNPDTWLDQWKTEEPPAPDDSEDDTQIEGEEVNLLLKGAPKFASRAAINDTKEVTATLNNAQAAMDKRIKWESSDPAKVAVTKATTNSGEANTLTLKAYFSGTVTISAYPALLGKESGASVSVTYENLVQSLEGGVVIFDDEISSSSGNLTKGHSAWTDYFGNEQTEAREYEGMTAMKTSRAVTASGQYENFLYYQETDGSGEFALGGTVASFIGGRQVYVMLHGVGQEGCENLPDDDDGTLYSVTKSQDVTAQHRIETVIEGNESWSYICFDMQNKTSNAGFDNEVFRFEIGEATYQITTKAFVHATGVSVSSPTITF